MLVVKLFPVLVGDGGLAVAQGEGGDAGGVGVTAHVAVGDADGNPHRATVGIDGVAGFCHGRRVAFGHDFHVPNLVGIADAKRLAVRAVAVFLHQIGHHFDGFAGCFASLQGDKHEAAVVDDACRVDEFLATAEGGLAEGHLVLVDVAHNLVSVRRLRHAATRCVSATVVAHAHAARRPVGGGGEVEFAVADVRVGAVADHRGAVGTGAFGNQEVGASLRRVEGGE